MSKVKHTNTLMVPIFTHFFFVVAESIPECEGVCVPHQLMRLVNMFFSDQLRVIQRMVDGVSDNIEDSLSLLQRLQQPTHTLSGTVCVCVCTL